MKWAVAFATAVSIVAPVRAQVTGSASAIVDVFPDPDDTPGRQTTSELRMRVFAERKHDVGEHVRLNASAYVEGLVGDRGRSGAAQDAVFRPVDLYAEWSYARFEVRAGASRIVWGRLDEFQPTDVVNPIDLTKFLLEGRSEARLSTGLVRGRLFLPGASTVEAILVPAFNAGRFDQLDEQTSPFNVGAADVGAAFRRPDEPTTISRDAPDLAWRNMQGGLRFTSTASRVDWAVSAYRGFRSFPIVTALVTPDGLNITETFHRFTMVGGDFETVRGPWGLRGELAAFVDDELQASVAPRGVPGKSIEAGLGVDRRAGDYRVAGNVLWSWRSADEALVGPADEALRGSDLTLIVAADRSFARETRTLRVFGVYDPTDGTTFGRVIAALSLRDNLWFEGSGGVFSGASSDVIGRLAQRDFLYARLKVFF